MVSGYIEGHPIISIPQPHQSDHVGLAQFTSNSIIPMLRFYSATFRIFMIMSIALILMIRPIVKLIRLHGWDSPNIFQKKIGPLNFQYRQLNGIQSTFQILNAIENSY